MIFVFIFIIYSLFVAQFCIIEGCHNVRATAEEFCGDEVHSVYDYKFVTTSIAVAKMGGSLSLHYWFSSMQSCFPSFSAPKSKL